jgi:hypothetical protein
MFQAERRFVRLGVAEGGHGPFRGLDAPFALVLSYARRLKKVNQHGVATWLKNAYESGEIRIFECAAEGPPLKTERDAVDLIGATVEADAEWTVVPVVRLDAEFFLLRTGVAGAFLQKFVTYAKRVAIVGAIPAELMHSGALQDLVTECNRGRQIWFVNSTDELRQRLARENPSLPVAL